MLYCLPFHGLKTGFRLFFRGVLVPPFQMPEDLMDFPLGKFGDNQFANLRHTCCVVPLQRCMYGTLHTPAFQLTNWPARRSNVRCFISSYVLLLIQLRQWAFIVSGSSQVTLSASKARIRSSCCSTGGSCSGNCWRFLQYSLSLLLPDFMVVTKARWFKS